MSAEEISKKYKIFNERVCIDQLREKHSGIEKFTRLRVYDVY